MTIVGVDLNQQNLKATVIENRFGFLRSLKTVNVALSENTEERNRTIIETMASLKKEFLISGIILGLPLELFTCRVIRMPYMKREDLKKALFFELENHLPLPVDEYIYDATGKPFSTEGKKMLDVLVMAIRRDSITEILKIFKDVDVRITAIRSATIASLDNLLKTSKEKSVNGIFIRPVDKRFEIVGLKGSFPFLLRSFHAGCDLIEEINSMRENYSGNIYLSEEVPLLAGRIDTRKYHIEPSYALAVTKTGNRSFDLSNLNFLPEESAIDKKDRYHYIIGALAILSVVLFLLTAIVSYYKDVTTLRHIENKIASIKGKASDAIEARKKIEYLQSDMKVLFDFQNKSNLAIRVMNDLSKIIPSSAWLINLSVEENGRVEIEGFAKKTSEIIIAIEKSGKFKNITFLSPVLFKDGEERFSIRMEVAGD